MLIGILLIVLLIGAQLAYAAYVKAGILSSMKGMDPINTYYPKNISEILFYKSNVEIEGDEWFSKEAITALLNKFKSMVAFTAPITTDEGTKMMIFIDDSKGYNKKLVEHEYGHVLTVKPQVAIAIDFCNVVLSLLFTVSILLMYWFPMFTFLTSTALVVLSLAMLILEILANNTSPKLWKDKTIQLAFSSYVVIPVLQGMISLSVYKFML